jgi:hypothetical protein
MRCEYKNDEGLQCNAHALRDEKFCYFHSDFGKLMESTSKGGSANKRIQKPLKAVAIKNSKDLVGLIAITINELRKGKIEAREANCIGYLSGHFLKAYDNAELVKRLEKLEEIANKNYN